jgi:hypothetical protein
MSAVILSRAIRFRRRTRPRFCPELQSSDVDPPDAFAVEELIHQFVHDPGRSAYGETGPTFVPMMQ